MLLRTIGHEATVSERLGMTYPRAHELFRAVLQLQESVSGAFERMLRLGDYQGLDNFLEAVEEFCQTLDDDEEQAGRDGGQDHPLAG